jgi:hypothetical protein
MQKNTSKSRAAAELVGAKPNLCWQNAVDVVLSEEYAGATYVEGVVVSRKARLPQEHGWVVFGGEIIDPTLPETELHYFPAHQWAGPEFEQLYFRYPDKPFFRHSAFAPQGVQVEMDKARRAARELTESWD